MADIINFLFLNVQLFPLYEVLLCLIFFALIYILFCALRSFLALNNKHGRFCSVSRQFWYHRNRDESYVVDASAPTPVSGASYPRQSSNSYSNHYSNIHSATVATLDDVTTVTPSSDSSSSSSSCAECCTMGQTQTTACCHPRERLRRLPRHLFFAFLAYCLTVVAFVVFALSIETQMVIDPHSCLNESEGDSHLDAYKEGDYYSYMNHNYDHIININDHIHHRHTFNAAVVKLQGYAKILAPLGFERKWYCNYTWTGPHEDVWLKGHGGSLIHGWWVSPSSSSSSNSSSAKTFLIAHGRSLPIPVYKDFFKQLVVDRGHTVFIFDYEGFGKSNGTPTEKNIYEDAEVALEYAAKRSNISNSEVALMGISLGGAVATTLAVKHNSTSLALISSIDSTGEEVRANLKLTGWAVAKAFHYQFDTYSKIPQFNGCLFFYVGGIDTIIPPWRGARLLNHATHANPVCTFDVVDAKADHCGMPGTALDNPQVAALFDHWATL